LGLELKVLQGKLELQELERLILKKKLEVLKKLDVIVVNFILHNSDKVHLT
jgi:hypothetical protein